MNQSSRMRTVMPKQDGTAPMQTCSTDTCRNTQMYTACACTEISAHVCIHIHVFFCIRYVNAHARKHTHSLMSPSVCCITCFQGKGSSKRRGIEWSRRRVSVLGQFLAKKSAEAQSKEALYRVQLSVQVVCTDACRLGGVQSLLMSSHVCLPFIYGVPGRSA